jgi:hypothetical protein
MNGDQANEAVAGDNLQSYVTSETTKEVTGSKRKPPAAGMGRPKGAVNKTTALLKDAILLAAQRAGGGGDEGLANYLQTQALANPGPFLSLLGKVLPMTVAGDPNAPVQVIARIERIVVK